MTQSQKVTEKASAFLNPLEKKLDRASILVQKTFTLDKLISAMTSYENIVTNAEQQEPLNKFYELLCNLCLFCTL